MITYYIEEDGVITQKSNFKFSDDCLETKEEIVRDSLSGKLYLNSDYQNLIISQEYLLEEFKKSVQYQHNAFNEFSEVINKQISQLNNLKEANLAISHYSTATSMTNLITELQTRLLAEQEAVIERVNIITEEYTNEVSS